MIAGVAVEALFKYVRKGGSLYVQYLFIISINLSAESERACGIFLGEVDAQLEDDTWTVIVNGKECYEVPLALIEGG